MKKILLAFIFLIFLKFVYGQKVITMVKQDGIYLVPCMVNGLQLQFIFDTGASDVSISLTEALFMLKNGYLQKEDIQGATTFTTASGEIESGTNIILRKIEFAGFELNNVKASVVNALNAPLLLGQSVISKLGRIQLDADKNTLTIIDHRGGEIVPEEKKTVQTTQYKIKEDEIESRITSYETVNEILEDTIIEANRVVYTTTVVHSGRDLYRKVIYNWGGIFYFKNGESISDIKFNSYLEQAKRLKK